MTEIGARVADLINFSSNQKPLEFETTFKEILQDRIANAIENKKTEIASKMFNAPEVESDEEELEQEDQELETEVDSESEEGTEEQEDGETA